MTSLGAKTKSLGRQLRLLLAKPGFSQPQQCSESEKHSRNDLFVALYVMIPPITLIFYRYRSPLGFATMEPTDDIAFDIESRNAEAVFSDSSRLRSFAA